MERHLDYNEYCLYRNLKRPIGGNNILKNEEEYNEYWKKIDWIQDWIRAEDNNRKSVYDKALKKSKILNIISIILIVSTIPTVIVAYKSTMLFVIMELILLVISFWLWWNGGEPKSPRKATVKDLLKSVCFSETTPFSLALLIERHYEETGHHIGSHFRLSYSRHMGSDWNGLSEWATYILLADALILDDCLRSAKSCTKNCQRCKAKEYKDYESSNYFYYNRFHWRQIYIKPPTDILLIYNGEAVRKNAHPLPDHIEKRYWGCYGASWKQALNRSEREGNLH